VSPRTGRIARFGEADPYILEQIQKLVEKGISSGGRTYPVQVISKDSQSSTSRASEVAAELILRDKVDLIVAASTPDTTNPVADQAEVNEVPCVTTDSPWSRRAPRSPRTVRGSLISSAVRAILPRASPGPIISSGGSRT